MIDTKKAVFIIDGSSFLYRAYYSIRPLTSPAGKPVQAVYGFCRMIKKLLDTYAPEAMVVVWDSKGKTERHELYTAYKETRQAPPSDLFEQKELIQQFADTIGLRQLASPGIEADDLMYSLAYQLARAGSHSILVTSDKDLGQAVIDSHVTLLDPFKDEFIDRAKLEQKYGFNLEKLPFYFALIGDASDNIPGVKGIGAKGATELVTRFASLEDLYNNLPAISSERTRKLLEDSKENAFLSYKLFLLRKVTVNLQLADCSFEPSNWDKAQPFFAELAFKSLLTDKELEKKTKKITISHEKKYDFICVVTQQALESLCAEITKTGYCAIDTETTGLSPSRSLLVGISFCTTVGTAYYIPFGHTTGELQLERNTVLATLKPILEDRSIKKYLHHAKFDALMLHYAGIELRGIEFDTMIAASLIIEDGQRASLKALSEYYLNEPMLMFSDIVKANNYKNFAQVPIALATSYAAADSHQTMRLYERFLQELKNKNLYELFSTIEMPLLQILLEMEKEGVILDTVVLKEIDEKVTQELSILRNQIIDIIGISFAGINLNSPKQLEELLFVHLKLPVVKKTTAKTGFSTDQEVLKELSKIHPVPTLIMRYRELFKLKSTYLEALGDFVDPHTGKVHTSFSQTVVATGRLASSDPNLQNIPVDRYHVRSAFKAPAQQYFLSADYSQIELRVLAYLSQDETLLNAFTNNLDIHALTASGLFDVPLEAVTHEQRQLGKRINFSILYGLTPFGLAKDLDISQSVAKKYIDRFMAAYPGVCVWMEKVVDQVKELGYVTTFWGRRRYLPGIYEKNQTLFNLARRVAINTKAQGTAAELMKIGMIKLDGQFKEKKLRSKMILQIHDELVIQVPDDELELVQELTKNVLQTIVSWNVPLIVTTRFGRDWQQITK